MNNFIIKYTPITLNDHSFNLNAIKLIKSLVDSNNPSMILIGNEGSGKTTIINNIVKEYYNECDNSLINSNILRICCLKDQGTTFCRNDLKIFCQVNSIIQHRKKIVRIDNLDLVNEQNQHIFRSLIDKYKNNVCFICSAIHAPKIIDQLQSRLILVKLNIPNEVEMISILNNVCEKENIIITKIAMKHIINLSRNSVTRMLNYLEKMLISEASVTKKNVNDICDGISHDMFDEFTKLLQENKYMDAIRLILNIYNCGYSSIDLFHEYYNYIKITHIVNKNIKYNIIIALCECIYTFYESDEHEIQLIFFTKKISEILSSNKS